MHVAIVGAGAIGCYLAAGLSASGCRVTLVGRPAQVDAITRGGLTVREHGKAERRYDVAATTALAGRPDLVLLTVKTQDVAQACREIEPFVAGIPVVAMQNGVRADGIAADVLGRDNVMGAVVMCAATYLEPGRISIEFPGWVVVGEPFARPGARTRAMAETLNRAVPTYGTTRLAAVRWSKLVANLNNALCAATGLTLAEVASTPQGRTASIRVMREGHHVVRAAGYALDHGLYGLSPRALRRAPTAAIVALLQASMTGVLARLPEGIAIEIAGLAARGRLGRLPIRGSTWQSIARGRASEIDYLNGEIVRLGQQLRLPTPYNSHVVALVREVERTRAFRPVEELLPPEATRDDTWPAVGGAQ